MTWPLDVINALEEVGDQQWYAALILRAIGFDFKSAFERNIAKLKKRFPDQFTEAQALTRDLDAERAALEHTPMEKAFAAKASADPTHEEIQEAREWIEGIVRDSGYQPPEMHAHYYRTHLRNAWLRGYRVARGVKL